MPLPVTEQIVGIPFRDLSCKYAAWRARQHRCTLHLCENIYRQATAKHPIERRIEPSALPSRVARSYRATTAYQAPVWPDFPPQVNVDTQSTCIRLRRAHGLRRERSFCMSLVRLLSRIPDRRRAETPEDPATVTSGAVIEFSVQRLFVLR